MVEKSNKYDNILRDYSLNCSNYKKMLRKIVKLLQQLNVLEMEAITTKIQLLQQQLDRYDDILLIKVKDN